MAPNALSQPPVPKLQDTPRLPGQRRGHRDSPARAHTGLGAPTRWSESESEAVPAAAALGWRRPCLLPPLPPPSPSSLPLPRPRGQLGFIKRVWGGDRGRGGAAPATHNPRGWAPSAAGPPPHPRETRWGMSFLATGPQGRQGPTDRQGSPAVLPEPREWGSSPPPTGDEVREVQRPLEMRRKIPRAGFQL